MTDKPEALLLADDRPTSLNDDLYQWSIDAEDMLRHLHESNTKLLNALRILYYINDQEAREFAYTIIAKHKDSHD